MSAAASSTSGLGVAVLGTGFGARVHVPALRAAGFEVRALVGRDIGRTFRRAARLEVPHACNSLDQALELPGVDCVTVATPPAAHAAAAIGAARAGRHVLCEKPFALDLGEARAMARAVEEAGVVGLVGHEFRWAPARATLGRALIAGRIGRPRLATLLSWVGLVADPAAKVPSWWFDPGQGGGWLGASGSHAVDQLRCWLGEFETVSARLGTVGDRAPEAAEDTFAVTATMASGATAVLVQTAAAWGPTVEVTRVAGDAGALWLDGDGAWVSDHAGTHRLEVPAELDLGPGPEPSEDPRHRFTHIELGPYTRLAQAWRDQIRGNPGPGAGQPAPATFADGVAVTAVLDAIRRSHSRGGAAESVGPSR
ncbi:MAG: Gfo/Idh/MocA family protein [Acidimicrobiales bacterium]